MFVADVICQCRAWAISSARSLARDCGRSPCLLLRSSAANAHRVCNRSTWRGAIAKSEAAQIISFSLSLSLQWLFNTRSSHSSFPLYLYSINEIAFSLSCIRYLYCTLQLWLMEIYYIETPSSDQFQTLKALYCAVRHCRVVDRCVLVRRYCDEFFCWWIMHTGVRVWILSDHLLVLSSFIDYVLWSPLVVDFVAPPFPCSKLNTVGGSLLIGSCVCVCIKLHCMTRHKVSITTIITSSSSSPPDSSNIETNERRLNSWWSHLFVTSEAKPSGCCCWFKPSWFLREYTQYVWGETYGLGLVIKMTGAGSRDKENERAAHQWQWLTWLLHKVAPLLYKWSETATDVTNLSAIY